MIKKQISFLILKLFELFVAPARLKHKSVSVTCLSKKTYWQRGSSATAFETIHTIVSSNLALVSSLRSRSGLLFEQEGRRGKCDRPVALEEILNF